jgi:hypothetical protein
MAIGATCVWEVRTTGAATNGGGYTSGGTDYSQQDASQLDLTDLACADTSTTLTSATGGFTAAMIGNIIHINSGTQFTAGFYEIKTRVDTNTVTIDRTAAVSGQNATAGVGSVGGCVAKPSTIQAAMSSGNTVYIKSGTYNDNVSITASGGSATNRIIGYKTTRNDEPTGTDRPLFNPSTGTVFATYTPYTLTIFRNLRASTSSGSGFAGGQSSGSFQYFYNCKASNLGGVGFTQTGKYIYCEATGCAGAGFYMYEGGGGGTMIYCYSHGNSGGGIYFQYGNSMGVQSCVVANNTGHGIETGGGSHDVINNVSYNNTGSNVHGFVFGESYGWKPTVMNNVSQSNGGYGFSGSNTIFFNNIAYGNGSGANDLTGWVSPTNLTSDPSMTDPANGDFTYQAGSPCLNAGYPNGTIMGATI